MKILVINPGGIGDVLLFTPALRVLREEFPGVRIDVLLVQKAPAEFLDPKLADKIIIHSLKDGFFKTLKLILQLRKERYDISIVSAGVNPSKSRVLAFLTGARKKLREPSPINTSWHEIDANISILRAGGMRAEPSLKYPVLALSKEQLQFAEEFIKTNNLTGRTLIAFHPGSSQTQSVKRWPKEYFIELGKKILSSFPKAEIFIVGEPREKDICLEIQNALKERSLLVVEYSLKRVAALLAASKAFVGGDSGIAHIAAAVQIKTIVLFGPTDPKRTSPRGPHVFIIQEHCSKMATSPRYPYQGPHQCMKRITSKMVLEELTRGVF